MLSVCSLYLIEPLAFKHKGSVAMSSLNPNILLEATPHLYTLLLDQVFIPSVPHNED